jgi:hypothetical protein
MHRGQLAGFITDCKTDDAGAAADFRAQALGLEALGAKRIEAVNS